MHHSKVLRLSFSNCGFLRRLPCAVRAGVVDQENVDSMGTRLLQQRTDRATNNISLISGRNDHGDLNRIHVSG